MSIGVNTIQHVTCLIQWSSCMHMVWLTHHTDFLFMQISRNEWSCNWSCSSSRSCKAKVFISSQKKDFLIQCWLVGSPLCSRSQYVYSIHWHGILYRHSWPPEDKGLLTFVILWLWHFVCFFYLVKCPNNYWIDFHYIWYRHSYFPEDESEWLWRSPFITPHCDEFQ